jgi:hypothetical protein
MPHLAREIDSEARASHHQDGLLAGAFASRGRIIFSDPIGAPCAAPIGGELGYEAPPAFGHSRGRARRIVRRRSTPARRKPVSIIVRLLAWVIGALGSFQRRCHLREVHTPARRQSDRFFAALNRLKSQP